MNFTKLKYFLVTADELNISRAAEKLFITQQALSSQISQLEQYYGVRLFNRKPVFSLTHEGLCLQQKAKEILQLEHDFISELEPSPTSCKGMLRIGYSRESGICCLPQLLSAYHQDYPLIQFELIQSSSQQLYDLLSQGRIDFMLDLHAFSSIDLMTVSLMSDPLVILDPKNRYDDMRSQCISPNSEKSRKRDPAFLAESPLLLLSQDHSVRKILDRYFRKHNIVPHILAESNDMDLLLSMYREGMGVTICPESMACRIEKQNQTASLPVSTLEDPDTICRYTLSYTSSHSVPPATSAFINTARNHFHM